MSEVEQHPVQMPHLIRRSRPTASSLITLRAYEVYCALYGEQEALVDLEGRGCRGGFGVGELVAFLYARSFPRYEWRERTDEALRGLDLEASR